MAPKFYSKEWCEAVAKKANSDPEYLKKAKNFTVKYIFVITDCPDGNDVKVLWDYQQGKIANWTWEAKKAPSSFRIGQEPWDESISLIKNQLSCTTMAKVLKKEVTGLGAIGAKLWKMQGDLVKGLKFQPYNALISDIQASVPWED